MCVAKVANEQQLFQEAYIELIEKYLSTATVGRITQYIT